MNDGLPEVPEVAVTMRPPGSGVGPAKVWHCQACHGTSDDPQAGTRCADPDEAPGSLKRTVCPAGGRGRQAHRWVLQRPDGEPRTETGAPCRCTAPTPGLAQLAADVLAAADVAFRSGAEADRARYERLRAVLLRRAARADARRHAAS